MDPNECQNKEKWKKFTLVELLIVVAVIGILVSLLLPALKSARDKAKEIGCANNLKQQSVGLLNYANDFNGWLPPTRVDTASCHYYFWGNYINDNYLKSPGIFLCASHPSPSEMSFWSGGEWEVGERTKAGNTYGYNLRPSDNYTPVDWDVSVSLPYRLPSFKKPSESMIVSEARQDVQSSENWYVYNFAGTSNWSVAFNHRQGANALFIDGHVKHIKYTWAAAHDYSCSDPVEKPVARIFWYGDRNGAYAHW